MGKFVIKEAKKGLVFNLKAGNGEVIATSQVYASMKNCKNGIESVMVNSQVAQIEDQTEKGFKKEKNPKFEVYTDKKGETRFRLKAKNGQIVASGEGYTTKDACLKGIASVRRNAKDAKIVQE